MTEEEIDRLPRVDWMPSRIPLRDALVTLVPKDVKFPKESIPGVLEQRWYPQDDGSLRLLVPHNGQELDPSLFHIEQGAWDHTTCDLCVTRIQPMTLCYVTKFDPYIELCAECYSKHVINRSGLLRRILWHTKRLIGRIQTNLNKPRRAP